MNNKWKAVACIIGLILIVEVEFVWGMLHINETGSVIIPTIIVLVSIPLWAVLSRTGRMYMKEHYGIS